MNKVDPDGKVFQLVILGAATGFGLAISEEERASIRLDLTNPNATTEQKYLGNFLLYGDNLANLPVTGLGITKAVGSTAVKASAVLGEKVVLRGSQIPAVKESLKNGREAHRLYKKDVSDTLNYIKEFRFQNGLRADYVDKINRVIYELKPDNPRAIKQGYKQLKLYSDQMFKETGYVYKIVLDTYTKK